MVVPDYQSLETELGPLNRTENCPKADDATARRLKSAN